MPLTLWGFVNIRGGEGSDIKNIEDDLNTTVSGIGTVDVTVGELKSLRALTRGEKRRIRREAIRARREEKRKIKQQRKLQRKRGTERKQEAGGGQSMVTAKIHDARGGEDRRGPTDPLDKPRGLRSLRKTASSLTGVHGLFSGKGRDGYKTGPSSEIEAPTLEGEDLSQEAMILKRRIQAIEVVRGRAATHDIKDIEAREKLQKVSAEVESIVPPGTATLDLPDNEGGVLGDAAGELETADQDLLSKDVAQIQLSKRVQELDRTMGDHNRAIRQLQLEKDRLQGRLNPLQNETFIDEELIDEYIEHLCEAGRLMLLNHTELWEDGVDDGDDEEQIGEDLFTSQTGAGGGKGQVSNSGGSWILRQTLGREKSIGEKIGETIETVTYRVICKYVMKAFAGAIGALHGTNVLNKGDIRLYVLPNARVPLPGGASGEDANGYATSALKAAINRGRGKPLGPPPGDFLQREAVTETLLSHCQISAPLLKLFPIALQRALLGNIVTLVTCIVSDAADGIQVQILGHQLTTSFKPMGETEVVGRMRRGAFASARNPRRTEEFERAVREVGFELSKQLKFLDKWHERVLGSGLLRSQIGNLIARLVLTLVDDILGGAKVDMWSGGGGPRVLMGVEFRGAEEEKCVTPNDKESKEKEADVINEDPRPDKS